MTTSQVPIEVKPQNRKKWRLKTFFGRVVVIILGLWIIFSIGYVARDQWIEFQNNQILTAYQSGVADTVRTLMSQAESCQPVSLFDGNKQIQVLKIGCGQVQPEEQPEE